MQIIKQSYEILGETPTDYFGTIKRMELAGRTCYRSEDRIVDGSDEIFIGNIVKRNHLSVVEQSNFVIRAKIPMDLVSTYKQTIIGIIDSKYIKVVYEEGYIYVGGNCRAFMERFNIPTLKDLFDHWRDLLFFIYSVKLQFEHVVNVNDIPRTLKRVSVKFRTDRAVLAEMTRHRPDIVFSVESQRYCAYRDELILIIPHHYLDNFEMFQNKTLKEQSNEYMWYQHMLGVERLYKFLLSDDIDKLKSGYCKEKAEEARSVLPNSTATDIFTTANLTEWDHMINLRTTPAAYKQYRILLTPMKDEFIQRGWY